MKNHVSDKSRRFSLLALDELEKIKQKYSSVPKIKSLTEEQISWLNERIRSFHESVVKTNYRRYSFLGGSKTVRNAIAHSTAELSAQEIESTWQKFFSFADIAKVELQKNLQKSYSENKKIRKFEKFGSPKFGDDIERKALTQSLADALDTTLPDSEKMPFASTSPATEVSKFLQTKNQSQKDFLDFAKNHSQLNEQIQAEILDTLQNAYDETEITNPENPFYDENLYVQKMQRLSNEDLLKNLESYKTELEKTSTGKDNSANFGFYKKQYDEILRQAQNNKKQVQNGKGSHAELDSASKKRKSPKQESPKRVRGDMSSTRRRNHEFEILSRNLKSDLQKSLTERYTAWQLEEIDKKRRAYLEELYKKIEQFKKLEELLNPFIKNFGRLWDLSEGNFDDCGFEILKDFSDLLENDSSLKELADLIGRQEAEKERYEKEIRDKVEIKTEYHPKPAYRGQISGLRLSGEISSALPTELAMSQRPATKLYFTQKFAEKKLLSYAYTNRQKSYRTETTTEEFEVAKKEMEQKGPVIICVDTSGSMQGTPERVAKTITFALAKKCLDEDRKCFLISFSTGIEVQDLSDLKKSNSLAELVAFLRKSFNGGTDASPALEKSLELMQTNKWKNADVLAVTDGEMGSFSAKLISDINVQKEKKSKFYLLEVGYSGNPEVINVFDEHWQYDTNTRDSMRHFVRKMHDFQFI